jgi:hypothetical protein
VPDSGLEDLKAIFLHRDCVLNCVKVCQAVKVTGVFIENEARICTKQISVPEMLKKCELLETGQTVTRRTRLI